MCFIKNLSFVGIFTLYCSIIFGQIIKTPPKPTPYHDWDYLIFSQRWPLTTCTEWEQAKKDNTCNLPKDKSLWTIHGVWPTKIGHEGPLFCPSAIHFNPDELTPILDDLKDHWVNVEGNTKPNSFWAHEWNKHGTCASILPQFDSVPNYFRMGLRFNEEYDLYSVLSKGGVIPSNDGYDIAKIYDVLKQYLNKEPTIQCIVDKKTKESFLSEIRICFNKTLDIIDCNQSNKTYGNNYGVTTNCNLKKTIQYISSISTSAIENDESDIFVLMDQSYENLKRLTWLYDFINTLRWLTL